MLRQRRAREPLVRLRLFGSRAVSVSNTSQLLMVAGMLGFQFVGALHLQRVLGYPPAAALSTGAPAAVALQDGYQLAFAVGAALVAASAVVTTGLPDRALPPTRVPAGAL